MTMETIENHPLLAILSVALLIVLITACAIRIGDGYRAVQALAAGEQLTCDVNRVDVGANEDVLGQVTQWNQTLRQRQALRLTIIGPCVVSGRWERMEPIEIPVRGQE